MCPLPPFRSALCGLAFLAVSAAFATSEEFTIEYLPLANKGIPGASIRPERTDFKPARPRPEVRFLSHAPFPGKKGSVARERVEVMLPGTAGMAAFGFPFAEGALFDLDKIRILDAFGKELPLQAHALALWPDGSVKSAYLQFSADSLEKITVEFGHEVTRSAAANSPLSINEDKDAIRVSTGVIKVVVGRNGFIPLREVFLTTPKRKLIAKGSGLEWRDENGVILSSAFAAPESVRVERQGPLDAVIRAEGKFRAKGEQKQMLRYIARLRFLADSGRVDLGLTFVNDALENEFTDTRSLGFSLDFPDSAGWKAATDTGGTSVFQWDEKAPRSAGWVKIETGGNRVQLAVRDFWQRWPKGIETSPGRLDIHFLPPQPEGYGKDFPDHLRFPFVEGHYRLKWGMAFTERLSFDFRPAQDAQVFSAEINDPLPAVLPPAYVAGTRVFGALPKDGDSENARRYSAFMERVMPLHLEQHEENREYGFLNFGDWFGERGRNWGNNEYDRSHGFFSHFLATGRPVFFSEALAAARHQADVDIVHAYPDPYYVGANPQHSIGHTGISYQRVNPKTWTYRYDGATGAGNGHTWADGMADAWLLTGDPVVMESLLALGEHIRWAFVPGFAKLGALERTAGWSIQAALAAFRATSDPEYLKAAAAIVATTLATRDPASGLWPHELPLGHSRGRPGVVGNSVYNMGILLTALSKYHEATGDPRIPPVLGDISEWLLKAWDEEGRGWPYSATLDGKNFLGKLNSELNPLIYPGLAYAGAVTGNREFLRVAQAAFERSYLPGEDFPKGPLSKAYSFSIHSADFGIAHLDGAAPANFSTQNQETKANP